MKNLKTTIQTLFLIPVLMFIIVPVFSQTITLPANIAKNATANKLPNDLRIPDNVRAKIVARRIDLSANAINFTVESCKDKNHGTVKIEGVIRNTGTVNYTSGANQQVALLYEDNGGRPRLVATKVFQNLTPGQEVRLSYSRAWYKGSPAEGEFPPKYILIVTFDPDIYIDGNDNNDDSNTGNNRMEKSGSAINSMPFSCK